MRAFASVTSAAPGGDLGRGKHPVVDPELLALLACPLTKQPLVEVQGRVAEGGDDDGGSSTSASAYVLSRAAGARFPVGRDGVPRLRPLQDGEVVEDAGGGERRGSAPAV
jgi:uncharacterized protein YbaR (Trm112 family)